MRRRLGILGLVVFVAGDIFLGYLAMHHVGAFGGRVEPVGSHQVTSSSAVPTTSTSPAASPSTPVEDPLVVARSSTLLALGQDGVILRATTGDCTDASSAGSATVQVSTDDGSSFSTVRTGVPQVLRVVAVSRADVWFVDTNVDCHPGVQRSGDTGASWVRTRRSEGTWHLTPDPAATVVHAPQGPIEAGCVAVAIAPLDPDGAYIGCDDGTTRFTSDGGRHWADGTTVDGLVGLAFKDEDRGFALAGTLDCAATVLATTDAGQSWNQTACLKGSEPKAIASNANLTRIIVQVGGTVRYSDDGGKSWKSEA